MSERKVYPHGTHARYKLNGCRCDDCRTATSDYERARRASIEPAYVAAHPAREHIALLAAAGVGLKTVSKRSGVAHGTLWKLVYGKPGRGPSKRIRKATLDAILAVTPSQVAGGARVDATATWVLLDEMIAAGVPKCRIAVELGQRGPGLQIARTTVTARNARAVVELHARWRAGHLEVVRRDRYGNERTITPPEPPAARGAADISDLLLDLAEIVEARNAQPWRAEAACRNRPTYMWFPAKGDAQTAAYAEKICRSCMVRDECRAANIDQPVGIYAAMSAKARRDIRNEGTVPRRSTIRYSFADLECHIATAYPDDGTTQFVSTGRDRIVTDTRIADLVGVDRGSVFRWRHDGHISAAVADRCARALGTRVSAIWPDLEQRGAA